MLSLRMKVEPLNLIIIIDREVIPVIINERD